MMAMSVPMAARCSFWSILKPMPRPTSKDDRGDAPDDAEHGEEAAELGLPQCGQRLLEDFANGHRMNRLAEQESDV